MAFLIIFPAFVRVISSFMLKSAVFNQVNEAAEIIYDLVDSTANLIFGAVVDKSLQQEVGAVATDLSIVWLYGCCTALQMVDAT